MKSAFLTAAAIAASASLATADITVITPWAQTTWTAGGHGSISWNSTAAEAKLKCDIQLMNGNATNSNMVASVTDPKTPVACSANAYEIYPLNDFASGEYWIRVGQIASNTWAYSGVFKFQGNGTARPYNLAGGASNAPLAAAASGSGSAKANANASASSSGAEDDNGAAGRLSFQGKTLAAAVGTTLVAALALAL